MVDETPSTRNRLLDSIRRWGLPIVLVVGLGYHLPSWFGGTGFYHDDGIYILTGRALAEGHGYRIESVPGAPPQTKYPILYPALLSVLWRIDGDYPANTVLFRAVNTLLWLASIAMMYRLLVRFRYARAEIALGVVAVWGFSRMAVDAAGMVLSEALCTVLVVGALWQCELALERDGPRSRLPALLAGLFCGLAFLSRSAALLLIVAVALALWRKSRPSALASLATAMPLLGGWLAWSRGHVRPEIWDLRLHYLDYIRWSLFQYQLTPWPVGLLANGLQLVFFAISNQVLYGLSEYAAIHAEWPGAFAVYAIAGCFVSFVTVAGAVSLWRTGRPLLPLAVALMILPPILQPTGVLRYLTPVGAIVVYFFVRGADLLLSRFAPGNAARRSVVLVVSAFALWNVTLAVQDVQSRFAAMGGATANVWNFAFEWVKENVPREEGILCEVDPVLFLVTGRKSISDRNGMKIEWTGFYPHWEGRAGICPDPDRQLAQIKEMNIRWAIDAGDPSGGKGFGFPNILRARPAAWELYHTSGRGGFHVYRLK